MKQSVRGNFLVAGLGPSSEVSSLIGRPKAWQTSRAKARLLTEDSSAKTSAVVDLETTQKQEASNARRLHSGLLIRRLQVRVLLGVLMGGGIGAY